MFQNKVSRRGKNKYERTYNAKKRSFNRWFLSALNKENCLIDGESYQAVFQDHSQSNNKDLSDDKYVIAENSTPIGVGSYVNWRGNDWLVFTEEEKTIPTHQQLKIKEINWHIKWILDDKIVRYGAHVQNQTLYTLGVSFVGDTAAIANAKMMMYMQTNADTSRIEIGQRIYIDNNVYKILFVDKVSRNGLVNCLMEQDLEHPEYDNPELGVADYYRGGVNPTMDGDTEEIEDNVVIDGDSYARISSTHVYRLDGDDYSAKEWLVTSMDDDVEDKPFRIKRKSEREIEIYFIDDYRNIGKTISIYATLENGQTIQSSVGIITKY